MSNQPQNFWLLILPDDAKKNGVRVGRHFLYDQPLSATEIAVFVGDVIALIEIAQRRVFVPAIAFLAACSESIAADLDVLAGLGVRAAGNAVLVVSVVSAVVSTLVSALPITITVAIAVSVSVTIAPVIAAVITIVIARATQIASVVYDGTITPLVVGQRRPIPLAGSVLAIRFQRISTDVNVTASLPIRTRRSLS